MTRNLTDEEKAIVYVDNTHCKYNEVLSRPYVVSEIRKAYIAGLTQERKELQAQIKKMKSLLKEVFEEYSFGELVKVRNDLPLEIQEIIGEKEGLGLQAGTSSFSRSFKSIKEKYMKILRKSVYSHYLKKYEQASKMLKAAYVNYNKLVGSFIETLNLCNCGNNSYWRNNPEKFFENQAALYETKEQLKHYRKALAYRVSLAKSLLKQRQREFTFAESNLHKAIKINGGISKRTAYDLLDTADIEKENYYKIESLTKYPIEGAIGFNPTMLKKQNECIKHGADYVR